MIILIPHWKAFDKIQHALKMLNKLRLEETILNLIKGIYKKPMAHIIFTTERLNAFPIQIGNQKKDWQGCLLTPFQVSIELEVLASAIMQEK